MPSTWGPVNNFRGPYCMVVESSTAIYDGSGAATNQWLYELEPADWGTDYLQVSAVGTGFRSSISKAINIWEINNTATTAMGLTIDANSTLQEAPNGAVVMCWMQPGPVDANGVSGRYLFQWPNQWECA